MLWIDSAANWERFSSGHHVLILRRAASGSPRRFAERAAVANSAAVIQRKNDVSAAGEVLIHGVRIRVVVHIVPAEEHLADRPAVKKNQRGPLVSPSHSRGDE